MNFPNHNIRSTVMSELKEPKSVYIKKTVKKVIDKVFDFPNTKKKDVKDTSKGFKPKFKVGGKK